MVFPGSLSPHCGPLPTRDAHGAWTGWPADPSVSGWHDLRTTFGERRRMWFDHRVMAWRERPDAFAAFTARDLVDDGHVPGDAD